MGSITEKHNRPFLVQLSYIYMISGLLIMILGGCGGKIHLSYYPNCIDDEHCPPDELCVNNICITRPDGGYLDGGPQADGGHEDGGPADGGEAQDGGHEDGGHEDGGPTDGGETMDGGVDGGLDGGLDGGCGNLGSACTVNTECCHQVCIQTTNLGSVCTRPCNLDCPEGWGCRGIQISSGYIFVCFPEDDIYCRPCNSSYECGEVQDRCVYVVDNYYCLRGCSNRNCPNTFNCEDTTDKEGFATKACFPALGTCQPCTPKTCGELEKECGTWHDGCLGTVTCGPCPFPDRSSCDLNGKCKCTPYSCSELNKQCGTWDDGCGGVLDCASCPFPNISTCDVNGRCIFQCQSGYHSCGTQDGGMDGGLIHCYQDDDIEHCGDDVSCAACQAGDSMATVACINRQCSYGCQPGYHSCDTSGSDIICYPDDSIEFCGNDTACVGCRTNDENTTVACLNKRCTYGCTPGYHSCNPRDGGMPADGGLPPDGGLQCYANSNTQYCGEECKRCEAGDPHALIACINDECAFSCRPGYHSCGTSGPNISCYASDDSSHCGDDVLCTTCEAGDAQALATCVNGQCNYGCRPGYHSCGTTGPDISCYASDDTAHCGDNTGCTTCLSDDPNATVACVNGQCFFGCDPGYHACGDADGGMGPDGGFACHADTDPGHCGPYCARCEAEHPDAAASCLNDECAYNCKPGFHSCGSSGAAMQCYRNDDTTHCGDEVSCTACVPAHPNVVTSCVNSQCTFNCEPGYHFCNSTANDGGLDTDGGAGSDGGMACHAKSDITHCGPNCEKCESTNPQATVACINDQCAYGCEPGYHSCGTAGNTIECFANDDIQKCGDNTTCTACQADDPNAKVSCLNGQCNYACQPALIVG